MAIHLGFGIETLKMMEKENTLGLGKHQQWL